MNKHNMYRDNRRKPRTNRVCVAFEIQKIDTKYNNELYEIKRIQIAENVTYKHALYLYESSQSHF